MSRDHAEETCQDYLFLSVDLVGSTALKQNALFGSSSDWRKSAHGTQSETFRASVWETQILRFYTNFADEFFNRVQESKHNMLFSELPIEWRESFLPEVRLWKSSGDELLFTCEIKNSSIVDAEYQLFLCLHAFIGAILEYRLILAKEGLKLNVKATAWMASFPWLNKYVAIPSDPLDLRKSEKSRIERGAEESTWLVLNRERVKQCRANIGKDSTTQTFRLDFIGPQIDTGFRLSSLSTPRKMVISAEIAYVLAKISHDIIDKGTAQAISSLATIKSEVEKSKIRRHSAESTQEDFLPDIYCDGGVELKGVLGGQKYPLFWIDTFRTEKYLRSAKGGVSTKSTELNLLSVQREIESLWDHVGQVKTTELSLIRKHCEAFFSRYPGCMSAPYFAMTEPQQQNLRKAVEEEESLILRDHVPVSSQSLRESDHDPGRHKMLTLETVEISREKIEEIIFGFFKGQQNEEQE